MLCNDSRRALEVLNLVPTISNELLQLYRAEALSAYQRLQTVVGHNDRSRNAGGPDTSDGHRSRLHPLEGFASSSCLPVMKTVSSLTILPSNASIDARSQDSISSIQQTSNPPSTQASSGSDESAPTPTSTVDLIEALDRDATAIKEFLSKPENIATDDELNRANEDPRVVDLQLAARPLSQKTKFRRISERAILGFGVRRLGIASAWVEKSRGAGDGPYLRTRKDQRTHQRVPQMQHRSIHRPVSHWKGDSTWNQTARF